MKPKWRVEKDLPRAYGDVFMEDILPLVACWALLLFGSFACGWIGYTALRSIAKALK